VALLLAAVIAAFSWFDVALGSGTGDRTYSPAVAAAVKPSYHLGIGRLELDLPSVPAGRTPLHVAARVDLGKLRIVVPANTPVSVDAHAKAGEIDVFRQTTSGRNARLTTGNGGVRIDARVGAGQIEVVRAR
jgi:hypothetical protein